MPVDSTLYQRPAEILQDLIRFDTSNPPGNEGECMAYIASALQAVGIDSQLYAKDPSRPNLFARIKGNAEAPPLLLYGHLDVVSTVDQVWQHDPFGGEILENVIWGRGALDMKGGVAMLLSSFLRAKVEKLELAGDVLFLALADEEVGGMMGADYMVTEQAELFQGVRFALGEIGGYNLDLLGRRFYPIQVSEKQGCGLEINVHGRSGHGSRVVQGEASARLGQVLTALDERLLPIHITQSASEMILAMAEGLSFPLDLILRGLLNPLTAEFALKLLGEVGETFAPLLRNTINTTVVTGGTAVNIIPGELTLKTDVRILPGYSPEDVIREVRAIIGKDAEINVVYASPNPAREPDMGLFPVLADILENADPSGLPVPWFLSAVTDARFFNRLGIQTYGFTPHLFPEEFDFMNMVHAPDERIPIPTLEFGCRAVYQALMRFGEAHD